MRRTLMTLSAFVAISAVLLFIRPGNGQPAKDEGKPHAFGDIILYIITKPKDAKSDSRYIVLEKSSVVRLGDRAFIVGTTLSHGDDELSKAAGGKRFWVPESDVVEMTEFKTLADAKRFFEAPEPKNRKAD